MTSTTLLIPITSIGLGTDTASICDAKTGRELSVVATGAILRLGKLFLPAESLGTQDGLHLVRFSGGEVAWVRTDAEAEKGVECEGCAA